MPEPSPYTRSDTPDNPGGVRLSPEVAGSNSSPDRGANEPLLVTKLTVPALPGRRIARPRLIEVIRSLYNQINLLLISAPAGFGKSVVVLEWLQFYRQSGEEGAGIGWFTIDEADNEPLQFWRYFFAAVAKGLPGLHFSFLPLTNSEPFQIEAVLTEFINALHQSDHGITFILEDYHRITNTQIHTGLAFLLNRQPPQLHLIMTGRSDPSSVIPLARLRLHGQLAEVRSADLRFTLSETGDFLNGLMGLNLSEEELVQLDQKTEGWIAALQLAALLRRTYPETTTFLKSFTGNQRFLLDYLGEEVFERQPAVMKTNLLRSAIVERFNTGLLEALTGCENGQALLRQFEAADLFLISDPEKVGWYRYHYLFRQYLRYRLEETPHQTVAALHRAAAVWLKDSQLPLEAFQHALDARDYGLMAGIIEENVQKMYELGDYTTLLKWLQALPDEFIFERPHMSSYYAWTLIYLNEIEAAVKFIEAETGLLERLEKEEGVLTASQVQGLRGEIDASWSFVYRFRGNHKEAITYGTRALSEIAPNQAFLRGLVNVNLGYAYAAVSEGAATEERYAQSRGYNRGQENDYFRLLATVYQAWYQTQTGQLRAAFNSYRHVLRSTDITYISITYLARIGLTDLEIETNEVEKAHTELLELQQLFEADYPGYLFAVYVQLARLQPPPEYSVAQQYLDQARGLVDEGVQVQRDLYEILERTQAELYLYNYDLAALESWVARREQPQDQDQLSEYDRELVLLLAARLRLAQDRLEEALVTATGVAETAQKAFRRNNLLKSWLVMALVYDKLQQPEAATILLVKAAELAEPEGFIRPFLELGPRLGELVRKVAPTVSEPKTLPPFLKKLLEAFGFERVEPAVQETPLALPSKNQTITINQPGLTAPKSIQANLFEPLTERELEVLRFLTKTTLSTSEIANRLTVAVSTVRTHVKNIYSKLEVQTRLEAIQRASELNLFN